MKQGMKSNAEATQDFMTLLDDLVREFLAERPGAAVGLEMTLLQRKDVNHVDSCHA